MSSICNSYGHALFTEHATLDSVKSLLRQNIPPQSSQRSPLKVQISEQFLRLSALDKGIVQATLTLSRLLVEKIVIERSIADCSSLMAPIRLLPAEVLSTIMIEVVQDSPDPMDMAMSMSHVSFFWRETAIATPMLWRKLFLKPYEQVARCEVPLQRSHQLPLHVSVDFMEGLLGEEMETALKILVEQSHRWETATFIRASEESEDLLSGVEEQLSSLTHLILREMECPEALAQLFWDAPALVNFHCDIPCHPGNFGLPWGNLQVCVVDFLAMDEILSLLEHCSQLVKGSFNHCGTILQQFWDLPIVVSHLTALTIIFENSAEGGEFSYFFSPLSAPVLQKLSLACMSHWPDDDAILTLLQSCKDSLHTLILDQCEVQLDVLLTCLRVIPQLTRLELDQPAWFDFENLYLHLAGHDSGHFDLAPNLSWASFSGTGVLRYKSCGQLLANLIQLRWGNHDHEGSYAPKATCRLVISSHRCSDLNDDGINLLRPHQHLLSLSHTLQECDAPHTSHSNGVVL